MKLKVLLLKILCLIALLLPFFSTVVSAKAQPFYGKTGKSFVLRASFSTPILSTSCERLHNICLACKSIDGTFLESGDTFSFNDVVGARTEKRGYKTAKIIVGGRFVDGVGGGVCQVSTTLYNTALLAGLTIAEQHPHSLSVGYVSPSFDAMVNSSFADLKFINETLSPIYIKTFCDGKTVRMEFYGEETDLSFVRQSEVTCTVTAPEPEVIIDDGSYGLSSGEEKIITYSKNGLKSNGYLLVYRRDKLLYKKLLRRDFYRPIQGVIVKNTDERLPICEDEQLSIFGAFSQYRYVTK